MVILYNWQQLLVFGILYNIRKGLLCQFLLYIISLFLFFFTILPRQIFCTSSPKQTQAHTTPSSTSSKVHTQCRSKSPPPLLILETDSSLLMVKHIIFHNNFTSRAIMQQYPNGVSIFTPILLGQQQPANYSSVLYISTQVRLPLRLPQSPNFLIHSIQQHLRLDPIFPLFKKFTNNILQSLCILLTQRTSIPFTLQLCNDTIDQIDAHVLFGQIGSFGNQFTNTVTEIQVGSCIFGFYGLFHFGSFIGKS
mmetsp:Transcript_4219/g.7854  ORF Transcript_4219/g.7854 Transcript_4219/m.7854 type:complete len:251 (+) Transcript_4219:35-787(+)